MEETNPQIPQNQVNPLPNQAPPQQTPVDITPGTFNMGNTEQIEQMTSPAPESPIIQPIIEEKSYKLYYTIAVAVVAVLALGYFAYGYFFKGTTEEPVTNTLSTEEVDPESQKLQEAVQDLKDIYGENPTDETTISDSSLSTEETPAVTDEEILEETIIPQPEEDLTPAEEIPTNPAPPATTEVPSGKVLR